MTDINPYSAPNPQPVDDPPLLAQLSTDVEGMTVEFEQTLEDVVALQFLLQREMGNTKLPRSLWILVGGSALLLLVPSLFFVTIPYWRDDALEGLIGALLIAAGGAAAYYVVAPLTLWLHRRSLQMLMHKTHNRSLVGLRRITISPQHVVWSSPATQNAARWSGVERVLVEKDCVYIFITALDAVVLPRRAFNSEQHFREYAVLAEKYRQAGAA